jgi:hypothetical protein
MLTPSNSTVQFEIENPVAKRYTQTARRRLTKNDAESAQSRRFL